MFALAWHALHPQIKIPTSPSIIPPNPKTQTPKSAPPVLLSRFQPATRYRSTGRSHIPKNQSTRRDKPRQPQQHGEQKREQEKHQETKKRKKGKPPTRGRQQKEKRTRKGTTNENNNKHDLLRNRRSPLLPFFHPCRASIGGGHSYKHKRKETDPSTEAGGGGVLYIPTGREPFTYRTLNP